MSWKGLQPSRPFYDSKHFHPNPPRTANLLPFSHVVARYIVPSSIGDPPRLADRELVANSPRSFTLFQKSENHLFYFQRLAHSLHKMPVYPNYSHIGNRDLRPQVFGLLF